MILAILLLSLPLFAKWGFKRLSKPVRTAIASVTIIAIFSVIVLTLKLGSIGTGASGVTAWIAGKSFRDTVLYALAFPILGALLLYLAYNFDDSSSRKMIRTSYGLYLCFFLILLVSIPIGYGSAIFDIRIFRVSGIESKAPIKILEESGVGQHKVYYIMGHTSEREILFDASTVPASPIVIERAAITAVKVSDEAMTLRNLLDSAVTVTPVGNEYDVNIIDRMDKKWGNYIK